MFVVLVETFEFVVFISELVFVISVFISTTSLFNTLIEFKIFSIIDWSKSVFGTNSFSASILVIYFVVLYYLHLSFN